MHTWAVKPKQHCTRGGEGRRGGRICSFWTRWLHGTKLKTALKCLNTFVRGCRLFCGGSEKSRFQRLHKEQFQNFLELYVRGRIYCFFNKFDFTRQSIEVREYARFQLKQLQWNPHFFEPSDNSNQKSFPSPSSDTVILVTPDFSKYPIFGTNFRFPLRFEKFGFNYNFGMIIRSLDVRNGSVFVFTSI